MRNVLPNMDDCTGCGLCENICVRSAIKLQENDEGFIYPIIDTEKCINCNSCTKKCPNNQKKSINLNVKLYSAFTKDDRVRMKSSSGGIFYTISQYVLNKGGIVFGAEFDADFSIRHSYCDNINEIQRFQTSKYVQSYLGDNYKKCQKYLNDGRLVFFTGTSCQIEGLLKYLQKDYENLITADLICSGNTSSGLWKLYLKFMKEKFNSEILLVNFRDKKYGWDRSSLTITFKSGKVYRRILPNDSWAYFFLNHYSMRNCCYSCNYKGINNHKADFTLGDFWGVREKFLTLYGTKYDDKGLSFVLVNTKKGEKLWKQINTLVVRELPIETVAKYNTAIIKSAIKPTDRQEFYEDYKKNDFALLEDKYVNIQAWKKINIIYDFYWRMRIAIGDLYRKIKKWV